MKKIYILFTIGIALIAGFLGAAFYGYFFNSNKVDGSKFLSVADDSVPAVLATSSIPKSDEFVNASETATQNVVFIKTTSTVEYQSPFGGLFWDFDPFGRKGQASSTGSGVIVNSDGYIVTNHHVIQGAETIKVVLNKGKKEYDAKIVGQDPSSDLALIKIDEKNLSAITFANSDDIRVGEWVLAVGNPFNLTSTVTAGIVSAKGRNINIVKNQFPIESFIQTDAAINPGNSGGALVNARGELVGINTAIQSNTGSYTGYGFAIPSNIVRKITEDFIEKGEVLRAFTGFDIKSLSSEEITRLGFENEALKISEVLEDGPADKQGIKQGDILIKVNDHEIDGRSSYDEYLAYQRPGKDFTCEIIRDGKKKTVTVKLIGAEENEKLRMKGITRSKYLGADFQPISTSDKSRLKVESGIRILNIQRGGAINQIGLHNGFIIVKFNGKSYSDAEDLIAAMEGSTGRMNIQGVDANGSSRSFSFYRY